MQICQPILLRAVHNNNHAAALLINNKGRFAGLGFAWAHTHSGYGDERCACTVLIWASPITVDAHKIST